MKAPNGTSEEVAGMVKVAFQDFAYLWWGNRQRIEEHGFLTNFKSEQAFIHSFIHEETSQQRRFSSTSSILL
ncbi:hypothetical protein [Sporosarcina sp. SAFN-010]|uniref:hypothetical protein n=1 Tax=Sporosarcina sp. SAFN-010 TaxID=3387273 RepID=UPI003F7E5A80